MQKKIFILSLLLLLAGCKKSEKTKEFDCKQKFYKLFLHRYSLWFNFESQPGIYDNFPEEKYKELRKKDNDSLSLTISCALKKDSTDQLLYVYKMRQLFMSDSLSGINQFFNKLDESRFRKGMYFQLSLYNTLSKELETGNRQTDEYKKLLDYYHSNKLNKQYGTKATEEFLDYLIDNDLRSLKKKILKKYQTYVEILPQSGEETRVSIMKDVMTRLDGFVFD